MQSISFENPWQYETSITEGPISSLAAHGVIETHSLPITAAKDVDIDWNVDVHNVGTDGRIAFGIANLVGNPGNFIVTWDTQETTINPDQYWRVHTINPVSNCFHLITNGKIRFTSGGVYNLKLWGMWFDESDQLWHYDPSEEINIQITVQVPWPYVYEKYLFSNVILRTNQVDIVQELNTQINRVDLNKIIGGRIDYTITYLEGNSVPNPDGMIAFNGEKILEQPLQKNVPINGSIDITGKILYDNNLTIALASTLLFWAKASFTIKLSLGFTEKPDFNPDIPFDWWQFIDKYGKWIALGVAGIVVVYMVKRPSMPIIVVGGSK